VQQHDERQRLAGVDRGRHVETVRPPRHRARDPDAGGREERIEPVVAQRRACRREGEEAEGEGEARARHAATLAAVGEGGKGTTVAEWFAEAPRWVADAASWLAGVPQWRAGAALCGAEVALWLTEVAGWLADAARWLADAALWLADAARWPADGARRARAWLEVPASAGLKAPVALFPSRIFAWPPSSEV
jgi:hypothetical protein